MAELSETISKGTTTVGIVFKDGVVLATERRATMGNMIASKKAKKVYQIADRIGMTTAGGVGDAQQLARLMQARLPRRQGSLWFPWTMIPFWAHRTRR